MRRGSCDCCDKGGVELGRVWCAGIETFACDECRGIEPGEFPDSEADYELAQAGVFAAMKEG